jgi:hypothetical protein
MGNLLGKGTYEKPRKTFKDRNKLYRSEGGSEEWRWMILAPERVQSWALVDF